MRPGLRHAARLWSALDSKGLRFLLTGGGMAAFFFVLSILLVLAGLPPFWGSLLAYAIALLLGYLLQRGWTFGARHRHGHALPRYFILQVGCALSSAVLAQWLVTRFGLSPFAMSLVTTGFAGLVSYVVSSLWVFPDGR